MSNTTEELSTAIKWEVFRHGLYIILGLFNVIFNGLIVLTVARHSALSSTKEYVCLGAGAFADAMHMLGTLCAGIYRNSVWLTYKHKIPASTRFCLMKPHSFLWAWFNPASYGMLLVLSIDRVISVAAPLKYNTLMRSYMLGMVSVVYGISFAIGAFIYVNNWPQTELLRTEICWSSHAFGKVQKVLTTTNSVYTLLSIVFFLLVPILYAYKKRAVAPTRGQATPSAGAQAANRRDELQRQLNKSVSLSCLFTFVFVALPWMIQTYLLVTESSMEMYMQISVWMEILASIDPLLNLWIYYNKLGYFRKGFKAMLQNKTLPMVLDTW